MLVLLISIIGLVLAIFCVVDLWHLAKMYQEIKEMRHSAEEIGRLINLLFNKD